MDVKGIAWVGHVYQKFEAMFLEVEEIMYEDTVKYVENQVQTVGASVKKFYSDVMEDLVPPSDEKVEASDLPDKQYSNVVICKKPSKGMEIRVVCPEIRKSTEKKEVIENVRKDEAYALSSYSKLGDGSMQNIMPQAEKPLEKTSICQTSYGNQLHKTTLSVGRSTDEIEKEKNVITDAPFGCSSSGILANSIVHESDDSIAKHDGVIDRLVSEVASPLNEVDGVFVSYPGRSDCWGVHEIESDTDDDPEKRNLEQFDDSSNLDESCVVIAKGDDLHFISHRESKNRAYRKKIKEAFSSKKRPTRRQEYEHLAEWYGSNPEWAERLMGDVDVENKQPETGNVGENEWELL